MIKAFILVGTSPLPCYISAIFLNHYHSGDKITLYLVYTDKKSEIGQQSTKSVAIRIKEELELNHNFNGTIKTIGIEDANKPGKIEECFNRVLNGNSDEIHLNFTGGTKTMSTFAYNYFKKYHNEISSFSYLDSRLHKMIVYNSYNQPLPSDDDSLNGDLRRDKRFEIDLKSIGRLHGAEVSSDKKIESNNEEVLERIIQLFTKGYTKIGKNLRDLLKELYPDEKTVLGGYRFIEDEDVGAVKGIRGHFIDNENKNLRKTKKEKLLKLIEGDWFEYYFYRKLVQFLDTDESIQVYFDVKRIGVEFQIDVIAIYGYQLCGISLTTASKIGICKQKAFEVVHRARQLGGEETKVILATFLPGEGQSDVNILRKDMQIFEGSLLTKSATYGIEELFDGDEILEESYFINIIEKIKE